MKKDIAIFGAGKIGRGFIGDIFSKAEYRLNFVDSDKQLTELLNERGEYTMVTIPPSGDKTETKIGNLNAYHTEEDRNSIIGLLEEASLAAVAVFPDAFPAIAELFAEAITHRSQQNRTRQSRDGMLDIIICANIADPAAQFEEALLRHLEGDALEYCNTHVGIVGPIVLRIGIQPSEELLTRDPLTVVNNGFPHLYVDRTAFKGGPPRVEGLALTEDLARDEVRKIYTYNMIHALFAYLGNLKGYSSIVQCLQDEEIMRFGREALDEAGKALQAEFSLSREETEKWNSEVLRHMTNPALEDTLERIGRDPARKIARDERLTGAALLARKHGIFSSALAKAVAAAFSFGPVPTEVPDATKEDIKRYTGLEREAGLIQTIFEQYTKIKEGTFFDVDWDKIAVIKDAYSAGFRKERDYKGCAQCLLAAMFDLTGRGDETLFQAAGGLSGGIGLCGDGSCGGYTGGSLFISSIRGRRLEYFDNDKDAQKTAYELSAKLHDKFIETYGSVTCRDIHEQIFGRVYILRTKSVRNEFEEAGAHADKCTTVVAYASAWTIELLMEADLFTPLQSTSVDSD